MQHILIFCLFVFLWGFPFFFGWKDAWRKGVGHKKLKGREVRDRQFLSFLCCHIFVLWREMLRKIKT